MPAPADICARHTARLGAAHTESVPRHIRPRDPDISGQYRSGTAPRQSPNSCAPQPASYRYRLRAGGPGGGTATGGCAARADSDRVNRSRVSAENGKALAKGTRSAAGPLVAPAGAAEYPAQDDFAEAPARNSGGPTVMPTRRLVLLPVSGLFRSEGGVHTTRTAARRSRAIRSVTSGCYGVSPEARNGWPGEVCQSARDRAASEIQPVDFAGLEEEVVIHALAPDPARINLCGSDHPLQVQNIIQFLHLFGGEIP